jgi:putative membrane protein
MDEDFFNPYSRFGSSSLTLNDYLAIDRTILSNERTLLAYGRTALAQVIIGGSALKFFDSPALTLLGWLFLAGGVVTMLIGWRRFHRTNRLLRAALPRQTGALNHPLEEKPAAADKKTQ